MPDNRQLILTADAHDQPVTFAVLHAYVLRLATKADCEPDEITITLDAEHRIVLTAP